MISTRKEGCCRGGRDERGLVTSSDEATIVSFVC